MKEIKRVGLNLNYNPKDLFTLFLKKFLIVSGSPTKTLLDIKSKQPLGLNKTLDSA